MSKKIAVTTLIEQTDYPLELCATFRQLCGERNATLLLESSHLENKQPLKSLMIIDSALRIVAYSNQVIIQALTENGLTFLARLKHAIPTQVKIHARHNECELIFPTIVNSLEPEIQLQAVSIFDALRSLIALVDASDHAAEAVFFGGIFSYDLIANVAILPKVFKKQHCPDFCFYLAETLFVVNHQTSQAYLQASIFTEQPKEHSRITQRLSDLQTKLKTPAAPLLIKTQANLQVTSLQSDVEYCQIIKQLQQKIQQGEIFQIVPSRRFTLACSSPLIAYQNLKQQNPSPYLFFMQDNLFTLFGASPESALKYDAISRQVEIYPIAGTRPRGRDENGELDHDLDSRIELEMRTDQKELAEHLMLVDLARNDLARVCEPGSRYVAELTQVDRYSAVMHLVSRVVGRLRKEFDIFHAYQVCMNMGTLTGAPKIRAMQLIAEVEGSARGSYGGAIGYFTASGQFDSCIVIRSAYVVDEIATIQSGAGIVLHSNPEAEAEETHHKARAVLNAILTSHGAKGVI